MRTKVHRRRFLKTTGMIAAAAGLSGATGGRATAAPKGTPNAEKLGWRLGCQAYSFNKYTFFEAVDKNVSVGLGYIEAYPGQKISAANSGTVGEGMSAADRKVVKQKLDDAGVKLVNFGVTPVNRRTFEFAKDMGIETIVAEPGFKQFDELDKLCEEFGINIALHNHPQPSPYWDPEIVLKACKGHSKRIGSCSDTGHWMRSGINPLEALKKLEGKIISLHFKDLNEYGPKAHDVPWGTGKADVKALLKELYRQKFKGVFSIEYEYHWTTSVPEIAQSVVYFDKVAAELAQ